MSDDWPQIKARLEKAQPHHMVMLNGQQVEMTSIRHADIRAALERESEMRDERDRYAKAWKESCDRNVVLRQRVEELEAGENECCDCHDAARDEIGRLSQRVEELKEMARTCQHTISVRSLNLQAAEKRVEELEQTRNDQELLAVKRAEAAEAKLARVMEIANARRDWRASDDRAEAAEARLAELEADFGRRRCANCVSLEAKLAKARELLKTFYSDAYIEETLDAAKGE